MKTQTCFSLDRESMEDPRLEKHQNYTKIIILYIHLYTDELFINFVSNQMQETDLNSITNHITEKNFKTHSSLSPNWYSLLQYSRITYHKGKIIHKRRVIIYEMIYQIKDENSTVVSISMRDSPDD